MDLRASVASVLFRLLIITACAAVSGVLTAKAFYCRDPDTGKLYPVNSTWVSSSFCGKYTCKLRKKSEGREQTIDKKYFTPKPTTKEELEKNCSQPVGVIIEEKAKSDTNDKNKEETYVNLGKFKKVDNVKNVEIAATTPDGDRYLTEEEITALSLLLQTMKKSDLEAILEVYNLAQDIYKELDNVSVEKTVNTNNAKEEKNKDTGYMDTKPVQNTILDEGKDKKIVSYWYEPLTNNKLKESDVVETHQEVSYVNPPLPKPKTTAMPKSFYEGLNMLAEAKNKQKIFETVSKKKMNDKSFFAGALATSDFRKLPYYHPLTNFQKQASYVRPPGSYAQPASSQLTYPQSAEYSPPELYSQPGLYPQPYLQLRQYPPLGFYPQQRDIQAYAQQQQENKSLHNFQQNSVVPESHRTPGKCCKPKQTIRLIPWTNVEKKLVDTKKYDDRKQSYHSDKTYDQKSSLPYADSKLTAKNLDFPLAYLQNYNLSSLNPYSGENTWSLLSFDGKSKKHQPPYHGAYLDQMSHERTANEPALTPISDELKDEDQVQIVKDSKELANWQTAPLPMNVLNEVKANVGKSKFLPYPFRKKVNLEKVGRFLRIEDGGRMKRDTGKHVLRKRQAYPEEYEVYIEKSTCETDTEPGFFRMGNTTEPFPACCPQRISS